MVDCCGKTDYESREGAEYPVTVDVISWKCGLSGVLSFIGRMSWKVGPGMYSLLDKGRML
jgi:hypothetical protein